jgi:hypothetical protein
MARKPVDDTGSQPDPSQPPEGQDRSETDAGHQSSSFDDVLIDQSTFKDRGTISDPSSDPSKDE